MAIDSWGTVKLPNGQRKEVRRDGDLVHVRDPGAEVQTTVALKDFLGALVVEMDRKFEIPMQGSHLVEALKISNNPLRWKFFSYMFYMFLIGIIAVETISWFR